MLTIEQIIMLISLVADPKVDASKIRLMAGQINNQQSRFKHGEQEVRLFIGQSARETGEFKQFAESCYTCKDPEKYFEKKYGVGSPKEKELGNDKPGDGYRYRGRGLIHVTGKKNYNAYSTAIGMNAEVMAHPELLDTDISIATRMSIEYWMDRVQPHMVFLCDDEEKAFYWSTYGVNAGELPDSKEYKKRKILLTKVFRFPSFSVMDYLHVNPWFLSRIPRQENICDKAPDKINLSTLCLNERVAANQPMTVLIIRKSVGVFGVLGEMYIDGEFFSYTFESLLSRRGKPVQVIPEGPYTGEWQDRGDRGRIYLKSATFTPPQKFFIGYTTAEDGAIELGYAFWPGAQTISNSLEGAKKLRTAYRGFGAKKHEKGKKEMPREITVEIKDKILNWF